MKNTDFMHQLELYFTEYLPTIKQASKQTIDTYGHSFMVFFDYLEYKNIKNYSIKFQDITPDLIDDFIKYLKEIRNYKPSSINQRLTAITSFMKYSSRRNIQAIKGLNSVGTVSKPKTQKGKFSYFTKEEVADLLKNVDTRKSTGLRDLTILSLLYDSAARESEICNLKLSDIKFGEPTKVRLLGKGNKVREVPLSEHVSKILRKYIKTYKNGDYSYFNEYLFINVRNEPITRAQLKYLVKTNVNKLKKERKLGFDTYSPHSFRHSKAIHMLEAGVPLIYIKDYLGHSSVKTTEIYAQVTQRNMNLVISRLNDTNADIFSVKNKFSEIDTTHEERYPRYLKNKK